MIKNHYLMLNTQSNSVSIVKIIQNGLFTTII